MVWFVCDNCGDSIKKPSLQKHMYACNSWSFTCVDCCQTFDRNTYKNHSTCVTEHEKYALGATKPGGFAANGLNRESPVPKQNDNEPTGLEFLSTRPPWKCSICNVSCTSKDTLMSHAAGTKHKRRARAALNAQNGGAQAQNGSAAGQEQQPASQQDQREEQQQQDEPQQQPMQVEPGQQGNGTAAADNSTVNGVADKKSKKSKKQKVHPALSDSTKFEKLVKVLKKRLKAKGKVGPKKLKALSIKKLGVPDEELDDALLSAIRQQLAAHMASIPTRQRVLESFLCYIIGCVGLRLACPSAPSPCSFGRAAYGATAPCMAQSFMELAHITLDIAHIAPHKHQDAV